MKVAVGCDHRGLELKEEVKRILEKLGHEIVDCGTHSTESVDYPDFGLKVAHAVADHEVDYGVTICWTGNGMNIAANKVRGVRAGIGLNPDMAYLTRLHNDANVLTLGEKYMDRSQLEEILRVFLTTDFEGGRHVPRVNKIMQEEQSR